MHAEVLVLERYSRPVRLQVWPNGNQIRAECIFQRMSAFIRVCVL